MMANEQIREHYEESLKYFSNDHIVGVFCAGSQNYGLDYEDSDMDSKLIVTPSLLDISINKKPTSSTHVKENGEHIDFKDIRLYFEIFHKQNLNFIEILFTPYKVINPLYEKEWNKLIENREYVAYMNPYRAVKAMMGIASNRYHMAYSPNSSKLDLINKYGYDGKSISHIIRINDYLKKYINYMPYEECLRPEGETKDLIMSYKKNIVSREKADYDAKYYLDNVLQMGRDFCSETKDKENAVTYKFLQDICYNIMKISLEKELEIK